MTNEDLISRQNVLRCLTDISYNQCKTQGEADAIDIAKTMVITMPSAQPDLSSYSDKLWRNAYERGKAEAEQRWIPVSERLPESRVYVLVTYEYQYGLLDHGISWYEDKRKEWMSTREVTAWMPLPESYRGDEDGK